MWKSSRSTGSSAFAKAACCIASLRQPTTALDDAYAPESWPNLNTCGAEGLDYGVRCEAKALTDSRSRVSVEVRVGRSSDFSARHPSSRRVDAALAQQPCRGHASDTKLPGDIRQMLEFAEPRLKSVNFIRTKLTSPAGWPVLLCGGPTRALCPIR